MTDTQSTADTEREISRVPYGFLDEVYASNRAYEATVARLEAEIARLRQENVALRGLMGEVYMDLACPEGSSVIERCRYRLLNVDAAPAQAKTENS